MNVLIIDDDPQIRKLIRRCLEVAGHTVYDAGDGEKGLAVFDANPIDLVVTDILMPGKEGLETIRALRNRNPTIRILAISGGGAIGGKQYLEVARRFGACRTLQKPFDFDALNSTVRELEAEIAGP